MPAVPTGGNPFVKASELESKGDPRLPAPLRLASTRSGTFSVIFTSNL